jgi:hypothetical protein
MLTETLKNDLITNIRNFLYNGAQRVCYNRPVSTFIETQFKKKFYECNLYNPLLYYLEKEWISFTWYGKISMTNHKVTERWIMRPFKSNIKFYLYTNNTIDAQNYNVEFYYTDMVSLLFSSWLLEYVIKERVASDDLISKLSEKWAMTKRLGLQDTRRVKGIKALWCDRSDVWQTRKSDNLRTGVQIHNDQEDWLQDGICPSGTTSDNKPI